MWCDVYICPTGEKELLNMLKLMRKMGYISVGVGEKCLQEALDFKDISEKTGLRLFNVYVVESGEESDFRRKAKDIKRDQIVIGRPKDVGTYRSMSRNHKLTIIEVRPGLLKHIDRGEAGLLTQSGSYLGFNLRALLNRPCALYTLKAFLVRVLKWSIPFRFFSSARDVYELWHPKQLYFIARSFGIPGKLILEGLAPLPKITEGGETDV